MASADLLRREEEFYESLFDSAKGDAAAAKTRGQMIERKIEALEDMATKVSNRRSRRCYVFKASLRRRLGDA